MITSPRNSVLQQMVIQDEAGHWWARKSPTEGEWHYHDGNSWVRAEPPSYGPVMPGLQGAYRERDRRRRREVLSAVAVAFAGVTWVVFSLVRWVLPATLSFEVSSLFYLQEGTTLLELVGTLVGLIGLHIQQDAISRKLGVTGLVVASMGVTYLLVVRENILFTGDTPLGMVNPLVVLAAQLARSLGFVLLGIAFLQARVLPRWIGLAFVVGGVVITTASLSMGYLPRFIDSLFLLVFGPIWLALGYALWPKRGEAVHPPAVQADSGLQRY